MSQQASQEQLNKFVQVVDKFMTNYAKLKSNEVAKEVYASNNPQLIDSYEKALNRGGALRNTIIATSGAWSDAKRAYAQVTGATSAVIGDAIDEIRSWFGYKPAGDFGCYNPAPVRSLSGLGAIQLPAAALGAVYITGVIAAATVLNSVINKIFVNVEASRIQRENPNITRTDALKQADAIHGGDGIFGSGISLPMIGAVAVGAYLFFNRK